MKSEVIDRENNYILATICTVMTKNFLLFLNISVLYYLYCTNIIIFKPVIPDVIKHYYMRWNYEWIIVSD